MRALRLLARVLRAFAVGIAVLLVVALVAAHVVPLPPSPDLAVETLASPGTRFVEVPADRPGAVVGQAGTIRTAVVEMGPATGPALVLVHGFGGSTFSWRSVVAPLAALGYRVVALDLANFGLSEKRWDVDTTHAAQARHVLAVMDALGIRVAVLAGHSMGGNVIVHAALTAPERVAGLVLVDAAVVPPGSGAGIGQRAAGALLEIGPVRQLARQAIRRLVDDDRVLGILRSAYADPAIVTSAVADGYLAQIRTPDWDLALLAVLRDAGGNAAPAPLAKISVPTLILWGALDPWIPLERGTLLKAAIPGARLAVIDDSGHLPMEETPESFLETVVPFLRAIP